MDILKQLVFIVSLGLFSFTLNAQKKYALLIGINDYYEAKGVKSIESLNGAVNDANAIKDLLISKFGFTGSNIATIYDAEASRDNIVEGLKKKLEQCKEGDLMVFYYSGHGVWMQNSQLAADPIKRGMNQAMLTSDLYNYKDHFKCLLRDFTLKTYFNHFVDKKVILTTIFDCCYSENLAMADPTVVKTKSINIDALMSELTYNSESPQQLIDSIAGISRTKPTGCQSDSTGQITDPLDSDRDGVPDCKDEEKFTDRECMPVNEKGVGKCTNEYLMQKALNKYDSMELERYTGINRTATRSFNAAEVLKISERDTIARPSERQHSKFLFISATQDWQKALEFKDENQTVHGLFTASILRAFKKYPANTPVAELFQIIQQDMKTYKKEQNPTLISDPARQQFNLIGTNIIKK
ncbi:MAG: caspase family protein [Ferruginibacter sp.]